MKSRIRTPKKSTREQTPDFSTAPAQPMFQSRPFVVQTQQPQKSQQPDLKTALRQAQRYGHHLDRITSIESPAPTQAHRIVQAKLAIGQLQMKPLVQRQGTVRGTTSEREASRVSGENKTGIPDNLKVGIENLSGMSMDDVKVNYNSSQPAQLQALAYTQGTNIHVAPGQEKHLAHEAWHVVQQKQGRVKPTLQTKGVEINNDEGLEREADVMGNQAQQASRSRSVGNISDLTPSSTAVQPMMQTRVPSFSGLPIIQRYGDKMAMVDEKLPPQGKMRKLRGKAQRFLAKLMAKSRHPKLDQSGENNSPQGKEQKPTGKRQRFLSKLTDNPEANIPSLQKGIRNIYETQKNEKKAARNKLDDDYQQQSANLEEKQNYLIAALKCEIFQKLTNDKTVQYDFSNQINSPQSKKNEIKLEQSVKQQLDNQAIGLFDELIIQIKTKMEQRRKDGNTTNKAAWNSKVTEYARDYGRHKIADPIVQKYEQGYKDSAMSRERLLKAWREFCEPLGFDLAMVTEENIGNVSVNPKGNKKKKTHIATVYFEEKRFVKVDEITLNENTPQEEKREIFENRETQEQYVQDAFDTYVRRHVKRALNEYDNPSPNEGVSIRSDPRKKIGTDEPWSQIAGKVPTMEQEEKAEEIRNHQRAKEKQGGSPFISFTTTERPIFGSSAKPFEGEKGVATVDLAQISKHRVFDTHTSDAMKRIHNVDNPDPNMPFVENNEAVERNSAARDAMRTREVVVAGDIPDKAITAVKAQGEDYVKRPSGRFHPR